MRPTAHSEVDWVEVIEPRDGETAPSQGRPPKVLIAVSEDWFMAARIADAFAEAGAQVEAVCCRGHVMEALGCVRRTHRFRAMAPLASLRAAIARARPDLIIPCDDRIVGFLHRLHAAADDDASEPLRRTIVRSLGAAAAYPTIRSRSSVIAVARALGLRAPDTRPIADRAALDLWLAKHGCEAVLKTDGSWGGQGVAVVHTARAARKAFSELSSSPSLARAIRTIVAKGDYNALRAWSSGSRPVVNVQHLVAGRPANAAVACWRGEVLGLVLVEAICTSGDTGPSTVVRTVRNDQAESAVAGVVGSLGLSGLCGFDFIIDAVSSHWRLIEVNPRATPTCHLSIDGGGTLIAALADRLRSCQGATHCAPPPGVLVALFPGELIRDAHSAYLRTAHHDAPLHSRQLYELGLSVWRGRRLILGLFPTWPSSRRVKLPPTVAFDP